MVPNTVRICDGILHICLYFCTGKPWKTEACSSFVLSFLSSPLFSKPRHQYGGCQYGGYVNDASQNNPTYEFFPSRGAPITSPILQNTLPVNLYPLTWLLPSGKLLVQSNWNTVLLDYNLYQETPLDDMPDAVRVYPASGGSAMLPLTPANNYTATIIFCGGSNISTAQ